MLFWLSSIIITLLSVTFEDLALMGRQVIRARTVQLAAMGKRASKGILDCLLETVVKGRKGVEGVQEQK